MTDLNALAERLERRVAAFKALSSLYENSELVEDIDQAAQALRGMGEPDELLRDQFVVAAYPAALADALRGYDHICDVVAKRAIYRAYECADAAMAHRSALKGGRVRIDASD